MKSKLLVLLLVFFAACTHKPKESGNIIDNPETKDTSAYSDVADFKFFFAVANLPSPLQIINTVFGTPVEYKSSLLNPTENKDKYLTAYKKSVNYGIYGVDLAYISNYGRNQDLINYYVVAKDLARELGVEESFDKFSKEFEENQDNKDSLIQIIDMAYAETDKYMKSNDRLRSSSHVLSGAFVESVYLALMLLKDTEGCIPCEAVFVRVYEQKLTLNNLINLLQEFKNDPESASLLADLETFKKSYDEIKDPSEMNVQSLNMIAEKIAVVRAKMIQ